MHSSAFFALYTLILCLLLSTQNGVFGAPEPLHLPVRSSIEKVVEPAKTTRSKTSSPSPSGRTQQFHLDMGETYYAHDGQLTFCSIGGVIFHDMDEDGNFDPSKERGVSDVRVVLMQEKITPGGKINRQRTFTTGSNGKFSFKVDPGKYTISVFPADGYRLSRAYHALESQPKTSSGIKFDAESMSFDPKFLSAEEHISDLQVGLFWPGATIQGVIYLDSQADGVRNGDMERGVPEVALEITSGSDTEWRKADLTDDDGHFSFAQLRPNDNYSLRITLHKDYKLSLPKQEIDSGLFKAKRITHYGDKSEVFLHRSVGKENQGDVWELRLEGVPLKPGDQVDMEIGVYKKARVKGMVWKDMDGDGEYQTGEDILPGVRVELYMVSLEHPDGMMVSFQQTSEEGWYDFPDLDPGDYFVQFDVADEAFKHVMATTVL